MVDQQAKSSLSLEPTFFKIPFSNFKLLDILDGVIISSRFLVAFTLGCVTYFTAFTLSDNNCFSGICSSILFLSVVYVFSPKSKPTCPSSVVF